MPNELDRFIETWEREAAKTVKLLACLPPDQYDFRPDPEGRSLGELAWHLAEGDAYMTAGIEAGEFSMSSRPPGIERPRKVEELAPGYERVHRDAVARIRKLTPEDLDRNVTFMAMGAAAHPRHPVEHGPPAQHPPPRAAVADVPPGRRQTDQRVRPDARGDAPAAQTAGGGRRGELMNPARRPRRRALDLHQAGSVRRARS